MHGADRLVVDMEAAVGAPSESPQDLAKHESGPPRRAPTVGLLRFGRCAGPDLFRGGGGFENLLADD